MGADRVMSALVRAVAAVLLIYLGIWLAGRLWGPALGYVGPTSGGWIVPALLAPALVGFVMWLLLRGE